MKRIVAILITVLSVVTVGAQSLSVSAPNVVSMDETFRVVFSSDGTISDFSWDCGSDFDVVWGPQRGSSSSTQIINGKRTTSHTESYTYLLQAKTTGKFSVPGATATVDKKNVSSKGFTIEVVEAAADNSSTQSQSSSRSQGGQSSQSETISGNDIYMVFSLNKTSVVKGEPVIATLKLYTRVDILGFEDVKFPTFNGFWSKEIEAPQNIEFVRENVDGKIYNSAVLRKYMLIPQQTGSLTIDPAELVIETRVSVQSSGPRSIFDEFFDSYQTVRKRVLSSAQKVNVKALPAGAPDSFGGGVGDFKMKVELSSDNLKSNEAASVKVTISGRGNVSMLSAPTIAFPPDFEVYDTKTTESISADGTNGTKTFEYPVIPRSHGDFTIAPVEYSYYDISAGKYVTLKSDELNIHIEKGSDVDGGGLVVSGLSKQSVKNLSEDVRYIAHGNPSLRKNGKFFSCSVLFFVLLVVLIALYFVADALLRLSDARRKDVVGTKNRRANKLAKTRLQQASVYKDKNLSSAYYEELHKALLGYVSDKLAIPVADLSKDSIVGKLDDNGVDHSVVDSFIDVLDACEYARYAPDADSGAMENHYNKAVNVISDIESSMKSNTSRKGTVKVTAIIALMTLGMFGANAQSTHDLWENANEAYAGGDYQTALTGYLNIEASGVGSSDLFYNIGNSYFKMNDMPHAILYFERALKYNPGNRDAKNNLAVAKQFTQDKIDEIPDFILATWIKDVKYLISADGWAWMTLAFVAFALIMLTLFKHSSRAAKLSFILSIVFAVLTLISFVFSASERHDVANVSNAIVMQPVSTVKSSPGDDGKTLFMLHEGTKVSIMDNLGQWTQIELADGRQGWITTEEIEGI